MDVRHSVFVFVIFWMKQWECVNGSGCQHPCACGFQLTDDNVKDESATLRYEVLGGLCGAFGPILIAALSYLIYKRCCSTCGSPSSASSASSLSLSPYSRDYPRDQLNRGGGNRTYPSNPGQGKPARDSTPTSFYGESDPDTMNGAVVSPNQGISPKSKWRNIHRNVAADKTNLWFQNVNKIQQYFN